VWARGLVGIFECSTRAKRIIPDIIR
jgi:hypothetical protein